MSTSPLPEESRKKLQQLSQKTTLPRLADKWGIDRRTLAEAYAGFAKRDATRFMIEAKIKEELAA